VDVMPVKELVQRMNQNMLSHDEVLAALTERLCDFTLSESEIASIKHVFDAVMSIKASSTKFASPPSHAPSVVDIVEAPGGDIGEPVSEPVSDWPDVDDDVRSHQSYHSHSSAYTFPPNHVLIKGIGHIGGKLLWDGKKIHFRVWKKRFTPGISNIVPLFKQMTLGVMPQDEPELDRLNMLLYDITIKAVPDTIMLDLEREAINDGVLAWKYLIGLYDSMTDEELDSLALCITSPSRCTHMNQLIARIGKVHDARAILESFGREQHDSAIKRAFLQMLPESMKMDAAIWRVGASIDHPGEYLVAREIENLIRAKVNPLEANEAIGEKACIMRGSRANVRCYGCGSFGHFKVECEGTIICSKCGKSGHHESICGSVEEFRKDPRSKKFVGNGKPLYNNPGGRQKLYTVDGEEIPGDYDLNEIVDKVDVKESAVDEMARSILDTGLGSGYANLFSP
jgi:hypothetical protein